MPVRQPVVQTQSPVARGQSGVDINPADALQKVVSADDCGNGVRHPLVSDRHIEIGHATVFRRAAPLVSWPSGVSAASSATASDAMIAVANQR